MAGTRLHPDAGWRVANPFSNVALARIEQWQSYLFSARHSAKSRSRMRSDAAVPPRAELLALVTACFSRMVVAVRAHPTLVEETGRGLAHPIEGDMRPMTTLGLPRGLGDQLIPSETVRSATSRMLLDYGNPGTRKAIIAKINPVGLARACVEGSSCGALPTLGNGSL